MTEIVTLLDAQPKSCTGKKSDGGCEHCAQLGQKERTLVEPKGRTYFMDASTNVRAQNLHSLCLHALCLILALLLHFSRQTGQWTSQASSALSAEETPGSAAPGRSMLTSASSRRSMNLFTELNAPTSESWSSANASCLSLIGQ